VGKVMLAFSSDIKKFTTYINGYQNASEVLGKVKKEAAAEAERRGYCELDFFFTLNQTCDKISLESLLIMPIQRVPRYKMLLENLIEHTDKSSPGYADLQQSLIAICAEADNVNETLRKSEDVTSLIMLNAQFVRDDRYVDLVKKKRSILMDGLLDKMFSNRTFGSKSKVYRFLLLTDMLLYAERKQEGKKGTEIDPKRPLSKDMWAIKQILNLSETIVSSVDDCKEYTNAFSVMSEAKSFIVSADSVAQKTLWLTALEKAMINACSKSSRSSRPIHAPAAVPASTSNYSTPYV
jgi:hypothetical protein